MNVKYFIHWRGVVLSGGKNVLNHGLWCWDVVSALCRVPFSLNDIINIIINIFVFRIIKRWRSLDTAFAHWKHNKDQKILESSHFGRCVGGLKFEVRLTVSPIVKLLLCCVCVRLCKKCWHCFLRKDSEGVRCLMSNHLLCVVHGSICWVNINNISPHP